MEVEMRRVDAIKPYENNPRINDGAVDAVAASVREFGWRQPIVVDGDGVIVVGHTRWKAAVKMGLTEVPVHVARDLTPEQARAYRIADNKAAEGSDWNYELLPIELAAIQEGGLDLTLLGFSAGEITELLAPPGTEGLTDPDAVPEPPDEAVTQPGDVWVLGRHRLMCGDSGSAADLGRLVDGATIDLVNMDPPYNVKVEPRSNNAIAAGLSSFQASNTEPQNHHQGFDVARQGPKQATTAKLRAKDRPLANDFVSDEAFDRMLAAWFANASRVLKPGGSFYIWGGYANLGNYPGPLKAAGLYFSQAIVWDKQHPVLTRKDNRGRRVERVPFAWWRGQVVATVG
ncbi:MAG TPA: ParB N-terminal domain-containing protein [Phycisphaerae bacterium]|nr:ParB N-terminal domain-containing protein [Phycisphaerae bacterium]